MVANSEMDVAETEEKIVQILSEAKVAMQMKNHASKVAFSEDFLLKVIFIFK